MRQSTRCRQIVKVDGIQERLYRIRVPVTIDDGRWRGGVPIFGHPAPEMIPDSPAVLNRIKHLKSEAQLPLKAGTLCAASSKTSVTQPVSSVEPRPGQLSQRLPWRSVLPPPRPSLAGLMVWSCTRFAVPQTTDG